MDPLSQLSIFKLLQFFARGIRHGRIYLADLYGLIAETDDETTRRPHEHDPPKRVITAAAARELNWWFNTLTLWKGTSIILPIAYDSIKLFTDASKSGAGVVFGKYYYCHQWTEPERAASFINKSESLVFLELLAFAHALETFITHLKGRKILAYCDNLDVVHIITRRTSSSRNVRALLDKIFTYFVVNDFDVIVNHIPSEPNKLADPLSRLKEATFLKRYNHPRRSSSDPPTPAGGPIKLQRGDTPNTRYF
jgi:hypothetical protein